MTARAAGDSGGAGGIGSARGISGGYSGAQAYALGPSLHQVRQQVASPSVGALQVAVPSRMIFLVGLSGGWVEDKARR